MAAAAKRELSPGDRIDGGGGYTVYGVAENASQAAERGHVPLELLEDARVTTAVAQHEFLTYDDVELETDRHVHRLRREQDRL